MTHRNLHKNTRNQTGMVSIMVTMIMMLVISLIVLGFAQVSRREQREALDRQLSSQAFFAAETGINDARKAIADAQAAGNPIVEKTTCPTSTADPNYRFNPEIDATNQISYTCLLVSTKLDNIQVNPLVAGGDSVSLPLEATGTIKTMHINWAALTPQTPSQLSSCKNNVPATSVFPKNGSGTWNCPYGVLRVDIVPTNSLNRDTMAAAQKTVFLYPTQGGTTETMDYGVANGAVHRLGCQAVSDCNIDITNMPTSVSSYGIRLTALYTSGAVRVTAKDSGGASLELKNAQIMVDATGKAQDVLRRVQVRIPMSPAGKTPDFAIESGSSICKRFQIGDDTFTIPSDIKGQDQRNPMCRPLSVTPPCTETIKDIAMVLDDSLTMKAWYDSSGSGSKITRLEKLKEVSRRFIGDVVSATGNHIAMLPFNSDPPQNPNPPARTPLTYDTIALNNLLDGLTSANTHCCTEYHTGMQYAEDALAVGRPGIDKIVVFISDGIPTDGTGGSGINPDVTSILAKAQELKDKGYTVYTIGITDDSAQAASILIPMASDPSKYAFAKNAEDLDAAIDAITATLVCH